eukprot:5413515-Heterocapsa_arctica.AAC.1
MEPGEATVQRATKAREKEALQRSARLPRVPACAGSGAPTALPGGSRSGDILDDLSSPRSVA